MDNDEKLRSMAEYHFNKMRTRCEFIKIVEVRPVEDYYIIFALFCCKKRPMIRSIYINDKGRMIK